MNRFLLPMLCAAALCGCCTNDDVAAECADTGNYARAKMAAPSAKPRSMGVGADAVGMAANRESSSFFKPDSSRMMAYTAGFTVTAKIRDAARDALKTLAESLGGYLVSSANGRVVLKVPTAKADEFLKGARGIGKVTNFTISAEDLTDSITDTGVRLDNLKKLRLRLTELLAKSRNVEEMLKVEREINRVTTEIERLEAQLQNSRNRVNFVRFTIQILEEHGAAPGGNPLAVNSFPFLRNLAQPTGGVEDEPLFDLELPAGIVPVIRESGRDDLFAGTTSDDCIFRTWSAEVPDGSTLDFWRDMVARALTVLHSYQDVKIFAAQWDGRDAARITASLTTAKGIQLYTATVALKCGWLGNELRIVEFFGPEAAFNKGLPAVNSVIRK